MYTLFFIFLCLNLSSKIRKHMLSGFITVSEFSPKHATANTVY